MQRAIEIADFKLPWGADAIAEPMAMPDWATPDPVPLPEAA